MDFWIGIVIGAVLGGFFSAVFTLIGTILYNRSKRPTPNYDFEFEKKVPYQDVVDVFGTIMPRSGYLLNYIRIENYGDVPLFNVSTKIWFDTRKERRYYQTMEISENLFDLEVEHLSVNSSTRAQLDLLSSMRGAKEVFSEKTKQGFFIPKEAMEKLKHLSPIKVKVEYEWDGNNYSDIWRFDFSDKNEVRFGPLRLTLWQKLILFLKKIF